jgi:glycosyltransferase involved in cell wall biosynthesis
MKVAIVGCQGLPARYGGYETLVEYLAEYKPADVDVTVYCSSRIYKNERPLWYKGFRLKYINLPANGLRSSLYDMYTILKSVNNFDKILILGTSGGLIIPSLAKYRSKFVLNIGGIEWKRSKYNFFLQKIVRFLMKISVKHCDYLVADNEGIKEYIKEEYKRTDSEVIAYGGDQAKWFPVTSAAMIKYPFLSSKYAFALARIQSDNNVEMLLESFKDAEFPLVYVGNWNISDYAIKIKAKFSNYSNLLLLDAIYDLDELNMLRSNCYIYVHAHSAGGTNPSLVEAMHSNIPIFCYRNIFNRFVTEDKARYFTSIIELKLLLKNVSDLELKPIAAEMKKIALEKYTWEKVANKYYDFIKYGSTNKKLHDGY